MVICGSSPSLNFSPFELFDGKAFLEYLEIQCEENKLALKSGSELGRRCWVGHGPVMPGYGIDTQGHAMDMAGTQILDIKSEVLDTI